MLGCCQSPVNFRSRNVEGNSTHKENYRCDCHFQGLEFAGNCIATCKSSLREEKRVDFSKLPTSWAIILEPITGNVVISEVDAFVNVVLSKAKNNMSYGEVVGTRECGAL
jgi:hypothetical protein